MEYLSCATASPGVALGIGARLLIYFGLRIWLGVSVCSCLKPSVSSVYFPSERPRAGASFETRLCTAKISTYLTPAQRSPARRHDPPLAEYSNILADVTVAGAKKLRSRCSTPLVKLHACGHPRMQAGIQFRVGRPREQKAQQQQRGLW